MTTKDTLIKARALIDTPHKWIKNRYAGWREDDIACYCAYGALEQAVNFNPTIKKPAYDVLASFVPNGEIVVSYNDHYDTTHEDIMNLFDKAIAAC
jgi:hypothetical protein